jgi:hypothetical protein
VSANVKAPEVDRMWIKLGFDIENKDDVWAYKRVDGKLVVRTRRSHGRQKMTGQIPNMIRQQMRLNQKQFKDAINCPLTREDYDKILKEKGYL